MAGAGFAPAGMAAMFEKLEQSYRLNDNGSFPYLRSHPLTSERIGEARARLGTAERAAPVSVLEHSLAQARARVLMDARVDALRRWQAQDAETPAAREDRMAAAYSSALASTLLREHERAEAALARLQALQREGPRDARAERAIALLAVQIALARNDVPRAEAALAPHLGDGSRPVSLLAARLALMPGHDAAARKRSVDELQTWVSAHPGDAEAWTLASQLWRELGEPLRSLRAEAEARVALGDLNGAVDRLRAGQRQARDGGRTDFIEASVIDARLRDIEALRRELAADERKGG
jgi:predicted Zn-dependent protease